MYSNIYSQNDLEQYSNIKMYFNTFIRMKVFEYFIFYKTGTKDVLQSV